MGSLIMAADRIYNPADSVAAIEQCRRTLDNFDPLGGKHIHRFSMITGLRSERSHPHAVRRNQYTITVKTADDRSRIAWAEGTLGDTRFAMKDLTDPHGRTLANSIRVDGCHRRDRLKGRLFRPGC